MAIFLLSMSPHLEDEAETAALGAVADAALSSSGLICWSTFWIRAASCWTVFCKLMAVGKVIFWNGKSKRKRINARNPIHPKKRPFYSFILSFILAILTHIMIFSHSVSTLHNRGRAV